MRSRQTEKELSHTTVPIAAVADPVACPVSVADYINYRRDNMPPDKSRATGGAKWVHGDSEQSETAFWPIALELRVPVLLLRLSVCRSVCRSVSTAVCLSPCGVWGQEVCADRLCAEVNLSAGEWIHFERNL